MPFDPVLSETARQSLLKLNVEVRLDQAVTMCDAKGVSVGGERIEAATIIWAAGVMASPAGNWLGAEIDNAGRVGSRFNPTFRYRAFPIFSWPAIQRIVLTVGESPFQASRLSRSNRANTSPDY